MADFWRQHFLDGAARSGCETMRDARLTSSGESEVLENAAHGEGDRGRFQVR